MPILMSILICIYLKDLFWELFKAEFTFLFHKLFLFAKWKHSQEISPSVQTGPLPYQKESFLWTSQKAWCSTTEVFSDSLLLWYWELFNGFLVFGFEELFQEERREREFLGGQIDMQECRKDKQIGIKYPILCYLRLQRDWWSIVNIFKVMF